MSELRRLPHLHSFARHPILFLTTVTADRKPFLANRNAFEILTETWQHSANLDGWFVGDYLLMPDHVHLFARRASDAKTLSEWMETWKSLSSRRLKAALQLATPLWQKDYFDRFLRSADNYSEKWDYVAMNPVRKGLCAKPEDWPWKGRISDLRF